MVVKAVLYSALHVVVALEGVYGLFGASGWVGLPAMIAATFLPVIAYAHIAYGGPGMGYKVCLYSAMHIMLASMGVFDVFGTDGRLHPLAQIGVVLFPIAIVYELASDMAKKR